MKKNLISLIALSASLAGCAVIDKHQPVPGWPALKVVEHHVSHAEMRDRCARFVSPFSFPEGCTLFYFDRREAHIYVSGELPTRGVLEHERLHAAGYDHIRSNNMLRVLHAWRATRHVAANTAKAAAEFTFLRPAIARKRDARPRISQPFPA